MRPFRSLLLDFNSEVAVLRFCELDRAKTRGQKRPSGWTSSDATC